MEEKKKKGVYVVFTFLVSIVFFILGVASSNQFGGNTKVDPDLADLLAYYEVLKNNWYFGDEEVFSDLILQAIKAMRDTTIDPYTYYTAPPEPSLGGGGGGGTPEPVKYGIGVTTFISCDNYNASTDDRIINEKGIVIVTVYTKSPAKDAGLKAGDRLMALRNEGESKIDFVGKRYGDFSNEFKDVKGTVVYFDVITAEGESKEVKVVRGPSSNSYVYNIPVYNCDSCYGVKVTQFDSSSSSNASKELENELNKIKDKDEQIDLIIDLRGNPGGYIAQFANMADLFLPKGLPLAIYEDKDGKQSIACSTNTSQKFKFKSITLLVDGGSASASEAFTLAMQYYSNIGGYKFQVVGEKTYGKGIAQTTINLSSGASIYYTFAKVYNPDGTLCIHGVGIEPDVKISFPGYVAGDGVSYVNSLQWVIDQAGQAALAL